MAKGKLISVEGIDGVGKTTLVQGLKQQLEMRAVDFILVREPGGVTLSEEVRKLVKSTNWNIGAKTDALLYAAARAQLVEELIVPTLAAGRHVIVDRFIDSSIVYQGFGRDLGPDVVESINSFATGGLWPDLTLLLQLDPEVAYARIDTRNDEADRFDQAGLEFFQTISDGYNQLAAEDPDRFTVIDAARAPTEVVEQALRALSPLLDLQIS